MLIIQDDRYVERVDLDNMAANAFYPPRIKKFLKSRSQYILLIQRSAANGPLLLGGRKGEFDNAAVDAFCPPRIGKFPKSRSL